MLEDTLQLGYTLQDRDTEELLLAYTICSTLCRAAQSQDLDELLQHNTYSAFSLKHKIQTQARSQLVDQTLDHFSVNMDMICKKLFAKYSNTDEEVESEQRADIIEVGMLSSLYDHLRTAFRHGYVAFYFLTSRMITEVTEDEVVGKQKESVEHAKYPDHKTDYKSVNRLHFKFSILFKSNLTFPSRKKFLKIPTISNQRIETHVTMFITNVQKIK